MPPRVLYEIPIATTPVRLIMGSVCLLIVLTVFGWWLPRVLVYLRDKSAKRSLMVAAIFLLPVLLGFAPLIVLVTLIANPTTRITETGVMRQSAIYGKPVSLAWIDITGVSCYGTLGSPHIRLIRVFGSDQRRIDIGNVSAVDLYAIRDFLKSQVGAAAMHHCSQLRPQ